MTTKKSRFVMSGMAILAVLLTLGFAGAPNPAAAAPPPPGQRFILVAKSDADFDALRADAMRAGGKILREMRELQTLIVSAPRSFKDQIRPSLHAQGVAQDHVRTLIRPGMNEELFGVSQAPQRTRIDVGGHGLKPKVTPDPAFSLPGLMWNLMRIRAPQAWKLTTGDPAVKVGVADTGLDYTHSELASQVVEVKDFTVAEDPPLCKTYFGYSDQDASADFGGPVDTDWNGHGSWIGGNIAAALDGTGVNGIAPNVKLVALKISQWCGSAYDSTILDAFYYAANNGIDVVSISFGGYLDRSDPEQDLIYQQYVVAVKYAQRKGTVIVAAAGNEHVRIGLGGLVLNHGDLTVPGDPLDDLYGLYELPGGIPGVVMVSATGNIVNGSSPSCPAGSFESSNATCKPASDAHQPTGVGKQNQLTYYSNYGPRIDVAAPGGARKFNVPSADRGGTPGWPVTTADGFNAWEDFSITSNWALQIPCYYDLGPEFYPGECYSTIQGTSMATPHASAVLALIASRNRMARHHPELLVTLLKMGAQRITGNTTPALSATDTSAGDLTGKLCNGGGDSAKAGYCHLGGRPIPDWEAYGAGLVDASDLLSWGH